MSRARYTKARRCQQTEKAPGMPRCGPHARRAPPGSRAHTPGRLLLPLLRGSRHHPALPARVPQLALALDDAGGPAARAQPAGLPARSPALGAPRRPHGPHRPRAHRAARRRGARLLPAAGGATLPRPGGHAGRRTPASPPPSPPWSTAWPSTTWRARRQLRAPAAVRLAGLHRVSTWPSASWRRGWTGSPCSCRWRCWPCSSPWSLPLRDSAAAGPPAAPAGGAAAAARTADFRWLLAATCLHWMACAPYHGTLSIHVTGARAAAGRGGPDGGRWAWRRRWW